MEAILIPTVELYRRLDKIRWRCRCGNETNFDSNTHGPPLRFPALTDGGAYIGGLLLWCLDCQTCYEFVDGPNVIPGFVGITEGEWVLREGVPMEKGTNGQWHPTQSWWDETNGGEKGYHEGQEKLRLCREAEEKARREQRKR